MKDILMPSFGSDMAKGQVAKWKIKPGESVKKGDIIATIETMKGLIDMEVFDDGEINELLVSEGEEIEVGQIIARLQLADDIVAAGTGKAATPKAVIPKDYVPQNSVIEDGASEDSTPEDSSPKNRTIENSVIDDSGAQYSTDSKTHHAKAVAHLDKLTSSYATYAIKHRDEDTTQINMGQKQRKKISPLALNTAHQLGINWQALGSGSGPDGAIVLKDIEAIANATNKATLHVTKLASSGEDNEQEPVEDNKPSAEENMRIAIGAVVSQSKRDIPHYYLELDIDLNKALAWLDTHNSALPMNERVLINAVIYVAIARALDKFPTFNGYFKNDKFTPATSIHLGNAISLHQGGLVVAAIHDAQKLNCSAMMEKLKDQVFRAREGGLRMSEMQDATITVSNLGDRGVDRIQSIIFPPQVAIIGIGRVRNSPWIIDNKLGVASVASLSLAADHRVSDGHAGARLLNKINKILQKPEALT